MLPLRIVRIWLGWGHGVPSRENSRCFCAFVSALRYVLGHRHSPGEILEELRRSSLVGMVIGELEASYVVKTWFMWVQSSGLLS